MTQPSPLSLGIGVGHAQAFGYLAAKCSAAQAQSMREIHQSQSYKASGLSWGEFCPSSFGLTRRRVDQIIAHLDEFGPAYFQLSEFLRISPQTFRRLAPHISGEKLEIGGQAIDIAPRNADLIRQAVARLGPPAPRTRPQPCQPATVSGRLAAVEERFGACIADLAALRQQSISGGFESAVVTLMDAMIARLTGLRTKAAR